MRLEAEGRAVVRWKQPNLYFGGVSAVEVRSTVHEPPATCGEAERHRRVTLDFIVRPADPSDAEALTRLAEAVSAEPEGWLISANGEWRSVGDERRYLKALRKYPNAAVLVAERERRRDHRSSVACA